MQISCTCSLRDSLWCNRSATVIYTRYILLGGNSTHSPTFPLVCNDCQSQKPPSYSKFSGEVSSPNAYTANTTILLYIVPVRIELYVLAASAMWAIMPLSASSCEQGAIPSLSLGCRKIVSLSIAQMTCLSVDNVTIYMLRNANSAVSFSLILSNSPHFFELHYWALLGDGLISLSCSVFALLKNLVCSLRRVLDIHCQIDSPQCLAQLTPARVGKARSVHVQLGASPHVIRWDIVCLSPQSHTSVWESFHIFTIARQRPFCTLSRFKLLQVDQGSSAPLAKVHLG